MKENIYYISRQVTLRVLQVDYNNNNNNNNNNNKVLQVDMFFFGKQKNTYFKFVYI